MYTKSLLLNKENYRFRKYSKGAELLTSVYNCYEFNIYTSGTEKRPSLPLYIDKIVKIFTEALIKAVHENNKGALSVLHRVPADKIAESFAKLYKDGVMLTNPNRNNIFAISKVVTNDERRMALVSAVKGCEF